MKRVRRIGSAGALALVAVAVCSALVVSPDARAQRKKRGAAAKTAQPPPPPPPPPPPAAEELGQEHTVIMAARLAAHEMQRYYEVVRVTPALATRAELVDTMLGVLEARIVPVARHRDLLRAGLAACDGKSGGSEVGCFPRQIALSYLYYGLARAAQGFAPEAARYADCAERVFPGATKEVVTLSRPPAFADDFDADLTGLPFEAWPYGLAVEKERARWPTDIRAVRFDVVPSPELSPPSLAASRFQGDFAVPARSNGVFVPESSSDSGSPYPILGVERIRIEPVAVAHEAAAYFAKAAAADLRRVLARYYVYDWSRLGDPAVVCPDPRVLFLPDGKYVMSLEGDDDFLQYFTVDAGQNDFLLEYFYTGSFVDGTAAPRIAWFHHANLWGSTESR